jgi:L-aminopeptidase/D-esterase-like protein
LHGSPFWAGPDGRFFCAMVKSSQEITQMYGVRMGHHTDTKNATGCTVVIFEEGAVGGVDVRGASPGTRETDLLRPGSLVERVNAILLSGGSAYGLDAASGVMRYLEEQGLGFRMRGTVVPIVPSAILFDLGIVTHTVRPGPEDGYKACQSATLDPFSNSVLEGSVGAGTGATVGKILGMGRAVKGGLGVSFLNLGNGLLVGAVVAVNAVGGIVNPSTGKLLAGPRGEDARSMQDPVALMLSTDFNSNQEMSRNPSNTTIGVVLTNATLTKEQANRLAMLGQDGIALAVRPSHTMSDGDVIFAAATGSGGESLNQRDFIRLGVAATEVVASAIVRGVTKAKGLGEVPSVEELGVD